MVQRAIVDCGEELGVVDCIECLREIYGHGNGAERGPVLVKSFCHFLGEWQERISGTWAHKNINVRRGAAGSAC